MGKTRIVVIGASTGGVQALGALASGLPANFGAPVLIVLHVGAQRSILPELLSSKGPLPASHAVDGEPIVAGRIYVAPPDHHLLVEDTHMRLSRGPKENFTRPAIDPLFRSAALAYGTRAIGVVLTGKLDDGTAGLQAIDECGGIAVVQDPNDAAERSMPLSALRYVQVDHCVPLAAMPDLLVRLIDIRTDDVPMQDETSRPVHEQHVMMSDGNAIEHLQAIGSPSTFVCPECKGSLWEIGGAKPVRYRCHTGHAFTLRTLQHAQSIDTEDALWSALRALQEKRLLLEKMAEQCRLDGDEQQAAQLDADARQVERHSTTLRQLIEPASKPNA